MTCSMTIGEGEIPYDNFQNREVIVRIFILQPKLFAI